MTPPSAMGMHDSDSHYMQEALQLAEQGLYSSDPNPRVGCVLVKDGMVVGRGAHLAAGQPHAEVHALREAGASARGAHAFVTLEPCCHHGRTGPCAKALIAAGVSKVSYALEDADPKVSGGGAAMLREAGIEVAAGMLATPALQLNRGFFSRHRRGRPWLRLKLAISLDGKVAAADGSSQWITGSQARADNQLWRARASAIMTGAGTANTDNPRLNVRRDEVGQAVTRQPLRVVLSKDFSLPIDAAMLKLSAGQVLVLGCRDNLQAQRLRAAGAHTAVLPQAAGATGVDLHAALAWLAQQQQVNELHVECGPRLGGSLLAAGLVDELLIYQANCLLGDRGLPMLQLPHIGSMSERLQLASAQQQNCGDDRRLLYRLTALEQLHVNTAATTSPLRQNLNSTTSSASGATCLPD